ncbi:hypothetical protein PENSOL_c110G01561 [Penicillium solitum]|uniref:Uncharacterized protein n=1 Tax=Penicillium solitum TaxID=60172 RepID=A0A1V6Q6G9_9EURO|nr:uncharacterized protein PENSOL_c110G01561 [Penicillium solitum]OQD84828.1 hypothetical protein PENSOL_c110G01561 [Penicillium solitum]
MPIHSQEYPTQASRPSSREMETRLSAPRPSANTHGPAQSALELPPGHSEWGLATYTHDRDRGLETRSFSFTDDQFCFPLHFFGDIDQLVMIMSFLAVNPLASPSPNPLAALDKNSEGNTIDLRSLETSSVGASQPSTDPSLSPRFVNLNAKDATEWPASLSDTL